MCSVCVISDFFLELESTRFFPGKHFIHFWRIFGISFYTTAFSFFDAEQVYLKLQVPISRIRKL